MPELLDALDVFVLLFHHFVDDLFGLVLVVVRGEQVLALVRVLLPLLRQPVLVLQLYEPFLFPDQGLRQLLALALELGLLLFQLG